MELHATSINEIIQYGFYSLISFIAAYGVTVLASMRTSIDALNIKIAVVIERSDQHDKILEKHDSRLEKLEES